MVLIHRFRNISIRINPRDHNPPHCHIEGNGGKARYNLLKNEFMESKGFTRNDLTQIEIVIIARMEELMNAWRELHGEE